MLDVVERFKIGAAEVDETQTRDCIADVWRNFSRAVRLQEASHLSLFEPRPHAAPAPERDVINAFRPLIMREPR